MKAVSVFTTGEIGDFIYVDTDRYPKIVLGQGGHKRATWISLGKRDAPGLLHYDKEKEYHKIFEAGVLPLRDKVTREPTGRYLIVAPRNRKDKRVLVKWSFESGYKGLAEIIPGDGVKVIAEDKAWHSGQGRMGETAEILVVMKPGQQMTARRDGRKIGNLTRAILTYDGQEVKVVFGDETLFDKDTSYDEEDLL